MTFLLGRIGHTPETRLRLAISGLSRRRGIGDEGWVCAECVAREQCALRRRWGQRGYTSGGRGGAWSTADASALASTDRWVQKGHNGIPVASTSRLHSEQQPDWQRRRSEQRKGYANNARIPTNTSGFALRTWKRQKETHRKHVESTSRPLSLQHHYRQRRDDTATWSSTVGDDLRARESEDHGDRVAQDRIQASEQNAPQSDDWQRRTSDADEAERVQMAMWERYERMDQPDANGDRPPGARLTGDRTIDTTATMNDQDASLLDLDYASAFPEALDSRNMDMTARCLFAALRADDLVWLRNIDQATFSTVLEVMEPANTIDRLAAAHRDISQAMLGQLGIMSMQTIAWQYTDLLTEILRIRTDATSKNPSGVSSADTSLTLRDYNTLLRSARDLGDRDFAALLWTRLHESWLRPDVNSWNYYMAAAVLHKQHDEMSRFNHRVTPFFQMCRRVAQPGRMFQSYRTGQNSVGDHVVKCFREMLQQGVAANEESYLVVITAAAREGDLDVVKSVLRRVWGVDVDAVMADAEEAESSTTTDEESLGTKALPKDSPAYPTAKLLFTVADAFSKNNTLPTALRLVDHLSRAYDIPIRDETWSLLFEWTFILAIPRGHTSKHFSEGKLPIQAVLSLWDTMVAAPYHVQPTMGMYDRLIKNLTSRQMIPLVLDKMQEGLRLYNISRLQTRALWRRLVKALYRRRHLRKGKKSDPKAASLEALRADWEIADLHRARNLIRVKRWLRLMLQTLRRSGYVDNGMYSGELSLRVIPRTLLEWRDFAPTRTRYEVEGGILEIKIRTEEEMDAKAEVRVQKGEMYMETLQKVKRLVGHAWLGAHRVRVPRRLLDFDNKRGGRSKTKPTA